ncbi:transferase family-domain-containing protein [Chaetomium strumarium]|uniref:Transferase family-domain-containing protein n=1 Tax=Chaetomium strumarium TaxID=1170767 RepID=A0AAJ0LYS0_9PEZI|nr:transferase family-domain-containing protein [Chaetomium strumarium]
MPTSTLRTAELSLLDQYMPRIYITLFLVFETSDPSGAVDSLKAGLKRLNRRLPNLKGRVFSTDGGRVGLRWSPTAKDVELHEVPTNGLILSGTSFTKLKTEGVPLHYFPPCLSPLLRLSNVRSDSGEPVFAANYTLLDGGLVVGLSVHHSVMDGTGVVELIRFWAACTRSDAIDAATPAPDPDEPLRRDILLRLATGHATQTRPTLFHDLLARHPEFALLSDATPAPPLPSPKGTSKLFTFDTFKLDRAKTALRALKTPLEAKWITTNSILCAAIWSCITRVRAARRGQEGFGAGAAASSKLGFAINGRTKLDRTSELSERPFLGNVTLYGLAGASVSHLERASSSSVATGERAELVVEAIGDAIKRVTPVYVAEVMELIGRAPDVEKIMPGWNSFDGPDLMLTSWMNMGLYEADFGQGIGKPRFMRVPQMEVDGFVIVLPRKRELAHAEIGRKECIEVVVAMHPEDMAALNREVLWRDLLA